MVRSGTGFGDAPPDSPPATRNDALLRVRQFKAWLLLKGFGQQMTIQPNPWFVSSRRSNTFHRPNCPEAEKISAPSLVVFKTSAAAASAGSISCAACDPSSALLHRWEHSPSRSSASEEPRIRKFALLPWRLFRGDPFWSPPLTADLLGSKLLGVTGLLTARHPYHRHAEVTLFMVSRGGRPISRISAAINHHFNAYHGVRLGFFDVAEDYEAAALLLDSAREWVAARGMAAMRGPGEYSTATHERQDALIVGFDFPPTVLCTHNPPFYREFLERWGLRKVKDYHGYLIDLHGVPARRIAEIAEAVRRRSHLQTRAARLEDLREEIVRVIHIYNQA